METNASVNFITSQLEKVPELRALFLSGSYGSGREDIYSDIDFLAVVAEDNKRAFIDVWRKVLAATDEIVLWREQGIDNILINTVLGNWLRIDVFIVGEKDLAGWSKCSLKPLIDCNHLYERLSDTATKPDFNVSQMQYQFEEFIRIFGLMPVAIGREEYVNGVTGVIHLRDLLIKLFIEETGVSDRGGNLHLNRLITVEQREVLQTLPPLITTREGVIEANLAYAAIYLPRARKIAESLNIDWPERFEEATWKHLHNNLGAKKSYSLD